MGALRTIWYRLEEGVIALLLAFMTILTFIQVVLRYGFGTGILWGQEAVLYAFAWLVLFGLAYGFRTRAHLGIDIIVKMMSPPTRRVVGLIAIACCALFAGLMLWGSYVYIAKLYEVGVEAQDLPIERWLLGSDHAVRLRASARPSCDGSLAHPLRSDGRIRARRRGW